MNCVSIPNQARPAGSYRIQRAFLRSTVFSCRSPSNSALFAWPPRNSRTARLNNQRISRQTIFSRTGQQTITAPARCRNGQVTDTIEFPAAQHPGCGGRDRWALRSGSIKKYMSRQRDWGRIMPDGHETKVTQEGIGLADAIAMLRDDLLKAQQQGANSDIQLPIASMTVELGVHATREANGKAGFRVPVINVELGGGASFGHGTEHTVTVLFDGPVDRNGNPVKVASGSTKPKVWVPKTCATWADALRVAVGSSPRSCVGRAGLRPSGGAMIFGLWA